MIFSKGVTSDLKWWIANVLTVQWPISQGNPYFVLQSDVSNLGWAGTVVKPKLTDTGDIGPLLKVPFTSTRKNLY